MYENLEKLFRNRIFFHFGEICKIPHQSFKEKELSDFIFNWAKGINLEVLQDKSYNLFIRKPAIGCYNSSKPIILQAHLDMVCEKSKESKHNFVVDPINLFLEGDILSTGGETTLGADNGIGVALAMAILENKDLIHPELGVIFTTAEEEDMSGALNVDKSWFISNRIINLDNSIEKEIVTGSAGGAGVELKLPVSFVETPVGLEFYKVEIGGLSGGHSGEDINKGLGNANVLLGNLMKEMNREFNYFISDIFGGNFRLAIPREAYAVLAISPDDKEKLYKAIEFFENKIKKVFKASDKNIHLSISETIKPDLIIDKVSSENIINGILLSPNGINNMFYKLNTVESSCNLGEIYIKDEEVYLITEIRATYEESREFIFNKIEILSKILGGAAKSFAEYPSWIYKSDSELLGIAKQSYNELISSDVKAYSVHAGLEPSCFSDKIIDMDAISIGPDTFNLHSPSESVSVSSTLNIYNLLVDILKKLAS